MTAPAPLPAAPRAYLPRQRGSGLKLMHCQCRAGVHDRAQDEEHQAFSITLVDRGQFTYRTQAGGAVLSPGWLMLGNAGDGYVCSHEESDGTGDDCTVLSLSAELLDSTLEALGQGGAKAHFERACLPPSPRVAGLFSALAEDGDEGFALEETTLAVVSAVRRSLSDGDAPEPLPRQDERARAAAHYIESRGTEELTLDEVAAAVSLSPFHLMRVFRRAIGVTPHQYLMRVRLMKAVAMLRDTALPVTDVAFDAGWADLSNFNRAFRRELGCSPRELRQGSAKLLKL